REQDAVVIAVRLGAEHGDLVEIGRAFQQRLDGADAGHPVADHHQFLLRKSFEHGLPFRSDGSASRRSRCRFGRRFLWEFCEARQRAPAVGTGGSANAHFKTRANSALPFYPAKTMPYETA